MAQRNAFRRLRIAITLGIYTALSPVGYALIAGYCMVDRRDPERRARRLQRLTAAAYRLMHDWLRVWRLCDFDPRRALVGLPPGPCVIVANHPTLMDVTSLTAVLGGAFTVAKAELHRRRFLRPLLEGAGHLESPGRDPSAMARLLDEATERLRRGSSLLLFPEGTRSPPGGLHRFGRTAFEIACRARVPIVSVGIRCEPVWLSKQVPLFDPPSTTPVLTLEVLAADDPVHVDYCSRSLRETVERRFRAWVDEGSVTSGRVAARPQPTGALHA